MALDDLNSFFTFTPEELQALEEKQIILSSVVDGRRRIRQDALDRWWHVIKGSRVLLRSDIAVSKILGTSIGRQVEFPEFPESIEALEFIGFTKKGAMVIWERYTRTTDRGPYGLFDYVTGHVAPLSDPLRAGSSPKWALSSLGVSEELQEALLDPSFLHVLKSEVLGYWLNNSLELRQYSLNDIFDRLGEIAPWLVARRKDIRRWDTADDSECEITLSEPDVDTSVSEEKQPWNPRT